MKVSSAVIKLVLRKNKTLADGTHPIMLRVSYNGMKEKSTHCSCLEKEWDAKNMQLRRGVQNCAVINDKLKAILREAEDKRDALEAKGVAYTASMLLDTEPAEYVESIVDLMSLEREYERERSLSAQSIPNRRTAVKIAERYFGREVDVRELSTENIQKMLSEKVAEGRKEGYVRNVFRILLSIVRFAEERGIPVGKIDSRLGRRYAQSHSLYYVDKRSIEFIKEFFLSRVIEYEADGNFVYRKEGIEALCKGNTPLFAIYLWLLIYRLQGLAPVDCALLRMKQLREITVSGVKYFAIDTFRSKTRKPVKIRVRMEGVFNLVVIRVMQIFRKGEKYFLPTLEGVNSADTKKVRDKMDTRLQQLRLWLKRGFAAINVIIEEHNSANKDTVPLIDCERANFYTARHSYAQAYLTSPNASPLALASLMGRSPNTLATYLQQLSSESDVTAASDVLI